MEEQWTVLMFQYEKKTDSRINRYRGEDPNNNVYVVFILVCTENMSTQFFLDKFFKFLSSSCGDLKIGLSCVLLVQFKTPCTID